MTFVSVANMAIHSNIGITFTDENYVGRACPLKFYDDGFEGMIWDCAHQCEPGLYKLSDDSPMVFSFYPTKNIASCEGGMIATNDKELVKWLRKARCHGMDRVGYSWDYTVDFQGWKMNMNGLQAALAMEQLNTFKELNQYRWNIVNKYNSALGHINTGNHLYRIEVENRDGFMKAMLEQGIECSVHFKPIHLQPAYYNDNNAKLPNVERLGEHTVSLPLWPQMTTEEVDYVITNTLNYLKKYGKAS